MVDHNINLNIKEPKQSGQRQTPRSASGGLDAASVKRLLSSLEKNQNKVIRDLGTGLEKVVGKAFSKALRPTGTAAPASRGVSQRGSSAAETSRIVKGLAGELSSVLIKELSKASSGTTGSQNTPQVISKVLDRQLGKLENTLSRQGIKLDPGAIKELRSALEGSVSKLIPTEVIRSLKSLGTSANTIQSASKNLAIAVKDMSKIRKSGGGIDVTEIPKFIKNLKDSAAAFKELVSEGKKARDALKGVADESTALYREISQSITAVRTSARTKIQGVQQRAQDDPRAFTKLVLKELSSTISKSSTLQGTKFEKTLAGLTSKLDSIENVAKGLETVKKELLAQAKSKDISKAGAKELITTIKKLTVTLDKIPKEIGDLVPGKGDDKLIKALESFSRETPKILRQVEVALDMDASQVGGIILDAVEKNVKKGIQAGTKEFEKVDVASIRKRVAKGVKDGVVEGIKDVGKQSLKVAVTPEYRAEKLKREYRDPAIKAIRQAPGKGPRSINIPVKADIDDATLKVLAKELKTKLDAVFSEALKSISTGSLTPNVKAGAQANVELAQKAYKSGDLEKLSYQLGGIYKRSTQNIIKGTDAFSDQLKDALTVVNMISGFGAAARFDQILKSLGDLRSELTTTAAEIKAAPSKEISTEMKVAAESVKDLSKSVQDQKKVVEEQTKSLRRDSAPSQKPDPMKAIKARESFVRAQTKVPGAPLEYPTKVIEPTAEGLGISLEGIKASTKRFSEYTTKAVENNITNLSKSLFELQTAIVNTLDEQFKTSGKDWAIVRKEGETDVKKIFKLSGGVGAKSEGRQWTLDVANVKGLRDYLNSSSNNVQQLIQQYQVEQINDMLKAGPASVAAQIGKWLKTTSPTQVAGVVSGGPVKSILQELKAKYNEGVEAEKELIDELQERLKSDLEAVFRQTAGATEAVKRMRERKLVKTVALPAARLTPTGAAGFETTHGSQRAVPKFATFKTGFERMFEDIIREARAKAKERGEEPRDVQSIGLVADLADAIRTQRVKPEGFGEIKVAENLAKELVSRFAQVSPEKITKRYQVAATSRGAELAGLGVIKTEGIAAFEKKIEDAIKTNDIEQSVDGFIDAMEKAGVTAYDVVKSLDAVKFENVYQVMQKVLTSGTEKKPGPLGSVGKQPFFDKPFRDFETAIRQIEQLLPIVEPGRPRRAGHMENVVNVSTRTGLPFTGASAKELKDTFKIDDQKNLIKDINIRMTELLEEHDTLIKVATKNAEKRVAELALPPGVRTLSSLGLPESQAGKVEDLRPQLPARGNAYLSSLNASMVKMYSDSLSEMVPFGKEFQQLGRNISNVSNAMTNVIEKAETPSLQTERERGAIAGGRFGARGLGYNVIAELRHSANTFEDQILISGKLASALTSVVKTIVQPGPAGRLDATGLPGADILQPQLLRQTERGAARIGEDIRTAMREFQKILGVPEEYQGRADQAFIDQIEQAITVVRGAPVEVQTAKITETFLNYFGRKFTTRYGSKGVSVTPESSVLKTLLETFDPGQLPKIKVLSPEERGGAALGTAVLPKSMGELASEILGKELPKLIKEGMSGQAVKALQTQLVNSGNKFIIDLFSGASAEKFVAPEEITAGKSTFSKLKNAFDKIGIDLDRDIAGISQIQTEFKKKVGAELFKETPIDIRISAHGLAKRGLQTEVLESVMNNIIGTGIEGPPTTIKSDLGDIYRELIGKPGEGGKLAEYSRALGFKPAREGLADVATRSKAQEKIAQELISQYGFDEDEAQRASALEAVSSFYSDVGDEFGKTRKSLVGPKFVQIIEEPGEHREWQAKEIEDLIKGERINLSSFAAYATVFGEQSAFIKEMQASVEDATGKHLEYIKALQFLNSSMSEMQDALLASAKEVSLSDIKGFDYSTGIFTDDKDVARSLKDTVFDVSKHPTAFTTTLPTGREGKREPFYVPGPMARQTFPERLLAGERGLDDPSRRLAHVVNMAKEVDRALENAEDLVSPIEVLNSLPKKIVKKIGPLMKALYAGSATSAQKGEAIKLGDQLNQVIEEYGAPKIDPRFKLPKGTDKSREISEQDYMKYWVDAFQARSARKEITPEFALAGTLGRAADLVVGVDPEREGVDKSLIDAITVAKRSFQKDNIIDLAKSLGEDPGEEALVKAISNLQKAKIDYYDLLANMLLGKKGSVQELVFARKIPAVIGKAITATVDKTEELRDFMQELTSISEAYGAELGISELESVVQDMAKVAIEHKKSIEGQKKIGLPVLKETEIGIPENLARNIPVTFEKKFGKQKSAAFKGTLFDMLEYQKQILGEAADYEGERREEYLNAVKEHIEKDLIPFVESVRFPFTGTSSIQPYKARAIRPESMGGFKGLEKNTLVVPGTPEFGEEFTRFKEARLKTKDITSKLFEQREALYAEGTPEAASKIKMLTEVIDRLNRAVSDVTPKYIAHQQKLDFDGDQIEIHAATTREARQNIKQHFDSMTSDMDSTAAKFRESFTYEAVIPSTGRYPLAEMSKSFAKKFPVEKGMDFLQQPFITKKLEYLSPAKRLGILSGTGIETPTPEAALDTVRGIIGTQVRESDVGEGPKQRAMDAVEAVKVGSEDTVEMYAQKLIDALSNVDATISQIIKATVTSKLYQAKYKDAIEAQLFKIHTGMETESIYALQRAAETRVGFGGGIIGGGSGFQPTKEFTSRFPKTIATGGKPEEEFHTMLNELVRFGIQKGMDVKHAGEKTVASEIVAGVASGNVEDLAKRIGIIEGLVDPDAGEKVYGDLKDFAAAVEDSVRGRLGKLPTADVRKEAYTIAQAKGADSKELLGMEGASRKELIEGIVKKSGFKAFLDELHLIIKEEAIAALIEDIATWSPQAVASQLKGKDPETYAAEQVSKTIQGPTPSMAIRNFLMESRSPLYGFRTSGASIKQQKARYAKRHGDIDVPEFEFAGNVPAEYYKEKYKGAVATAKNIQDALAQAEKADDKGAYASIVNSTIANLKANQAKVDQIIAQLEAEGLTEPAPIVGRALGIDRITGLTQSVLGGKKDISELSTLAGVPRFTKLEKSELEQTITPELAKYASEAIDKAGKSTEQYSTEVEALTMELVKVGTTIAEMDRVITGFLSKKGEGKFISELLSSEAARPATLPTSRTAPTTASDLFKIMFKDEPADRPKGPPVGPGGPGGGPGAPSGATIPVYLVGIAPDIKFNFSETRSAVAGATATRRSSDLKPDEFLMNKLKSYEEARALAAQAGGDLHKYTGASFEEQYRASGLKGGSRRQVDDIVKVMTATQEDSRDSLLEAASLLGTGVHAKKEKELQGRPGVETETFVQYTDEVAGLITGHIDSLYRSQEGVVEKIADIKTTNARLIADLKEAISKTGSSEFEKIKDFVSPTTRNKLEEVASQLNLYLKATNEDAKAEAQFYDRFDLSEMIPISFKFDPARLKKDMQSVAMAREEIKKAGGTFAKTASPEESIKAAQERKDLTDEEIRSLINIAESYFKEKQTRGRASRAMPRDEDPADTDYRKQAKRVRERIEAEMADRREDTFRPTHVVEGTSAEAIFENIKALQDQAKLFQKELGVSFDAMETFPDEIKKQISDVPFKGPDYTEFIDITNDLKESGEISYTEFIRAWKLYKAAVADFMIAKAEEAKLLLSEAEKAGDDSEALQQFGNFQQRVKSIQSHIRKGLGKATDIYTRDKRYISPRLAEGAGVFQSPAQLMQRASAPLGEDRQLDAVYKRIIEDLKPGGAVQVAPIEKVRTAISTLTNMKPELTDLLSDADIFKKLGPEVVEAWDLSGIVAKLTRLRAALQLFARFNVSEDFQVEQKQNIDDVIRGLQSIEKMYSAINIEATQFQGNLEEFKGAIPTIPVPRVLPVREQEALHGRNIQKVRQFFETPQEEGGAAVGQKFNYVTKVVDEFNNVIQNGITHFRKYGEELNMMGQFVGQVEEGHTDLIAAMQTSNKSFGNAIRRVVMWGAASRLVYGGVSKLKETIGTISDVETSVASLRMVMNPITTDFEMMSKAAVGFAKEYGSSVSGVLDSMRIFAQQGLSQAEVLNRTKTATLAANVTTLNAMDATEAMTAATKVFGTESITAASALDSWSEVEARHAIRAGDMANAIKKSASAAKNAGFTFHELNGIVAAIGSTTRQTGKEVGTSMRFIARRLFSDKGPKELQGLGIPVVTGAGDYRRGFDILGDLAGKWGELTNAQKLNVAQSIGGTRQYNALLVLMDNWGEALEAIQDSTDSKGSAERRNLELMKTYEKQLQQTKAAAAELQLAFGKIYLPVAKFGLKGLRVFLETVSAIPNVVKGAAVGFGLLFTAISKGSGMIDWLVKEFSQGKSIIGDLIGSFKKDVKVGIFELFGKGDTQDVDLFNVEPIVGSTKKWYEYSSTIGKVGAALVGAGRSYNEFLAAGVKGAAFGPKVVGSSLNAIGGFLDNLIDKLQVGALAVPGVLDDIILAAAEVGSKGTKGLGGVFDLIGDTLGSGAENFAKNFASENTGLVKSFGPLAVTIAGLVPLFGILRKGYLETAASAAAYRDSLKPLIQVQDKELATIKNQQISLRGINTAYKDARKLDDPQVAKKRVEAGTYVSPTEKLIGVYDKAIQFTNQLAEANINLVAGYDEAGNAVLKSGVNLEKYLSSIKSGIVGEAFETQISIIEKYIRELTDTSKKWTETLANILEELPFGGDKLAKLFSISPARGIDKTQEQLNSLFNIKIKYPQFSPTLDKEIGKLQKIIGSAKKEFDSYKKELITFFKNLNVEGLSPYDITKRMFDVEGIGTAAEFLVSPAVKSRFKDISAEDIIGAETLKKIFPALAPIIQVTPEFTLEKAKELGIKPRAAGQAYDTDMIIFGKGMAEQLQVATGQGVIQSKQIIRETADGIVKDIEWSVGYINEQTKEWEIRPLSEIGRFAQEILPASEIKKQLDTDIALLTEFVSGAGAGLRAIGAKAFKKDFSLGESFFDQLPTTTILQTERGFAPGIGTGPAGIGAFSVDSPFQKGFGEDIRKFYIEPLDEYNATVASFSKSDVGPDQRTRDELIALQNVLKNNQVVFQFRSAIVDLTKAFSEATRGAMEAEAVERGRQETIKITSGYLKGIPEGLENIDIGVQRYADLSTRQRSLLEDPGARAAAQEFNVAKARKDVFAGLLDSVNKTAAAIDFMHDQASGLEQLFDIQNIPEKDRDRYFDSLVSTSFDLPMASIDNKMGSVVDNTGAMVPLLEELAGKELETPDALKAIVERFGTPDRSVGYRARDIGAVIKLRGKAIEEGAPRKEIADIDAEITRLTRAFVDIEGFTRAEKKLDLHKIFKPQEFIQRVFADVSPRALLGQAKALPSDVVQPPRKSFFGMPLETQKFKGEEYYTTPGGFPLKKRDVEQVQESKEYKVLMDVRKKAESRESISTKTWEKAALFMTTISSMQKHEGAKRLKVLYAEEKKLAERINLRKEAGIPPEQMVKDRDKLMQVGSKIKVEEQKRQFATTAQAVSIISGGAVELGRTLGLTSSQIKIMGVGAASAYAALKVTSAVLGEDMPGYAKEFGVGLKDVIKKAAFGEDVKFDLAKLASKGRSFKKKFEKDVEERTGLKESDIKEAYKKTISASKGDEVSIKDREKNAREIQATLATRAEESMGFIQKALLAGAIQFAGGLLFSRNDEKVFLSTMEKTAEDESQAFADLHKKFPTILPALYAARKAVDAELKKAKEDEVTTTIKTPKFMDVDEEYELVQGNVEKFREVLRNIISGIDQSLDESSSKLASSAYAIDFRKPFDDLNDQIIGLDISSKIQSTMRAVRLDDDTFQPLAKNIGDKLAGLFRPGTLDRGVRSVADMSPEEYLVYTKPEEGKRFEALSNLMQQQELEADLLGQKSKELYGLKLKQDTGVELTGDDARDLEMLPTAIEELLQRLKKSGVGIEKIKDILAKGVDGITSTLTGAITDLTNAMVRSVDNYIDTLKTGTGIFAGAAPIKEGALPFGPASLQDLSMDQLTRLIGGSDVKNFEETYRKQQEAIEKARNAEQVRLKALEGGEDSSAYKDAAKGAAKAEEELNKLSKALVADEKSARKHVATVLKLRGAYDLATEVISGFINFTVDRMYSLDSVINKYSAGFPGEVPVMPIFSDMSTQERLFSTMGDDYRDFINSFQEASTVMLPILRKQLEENLLKAKQLESEGRFDEAAGFAKDAETARIEVEKLGDKLRVMSDIISPVIRFADALYKLKDALKQISAKQLFDELPGMDKYREAMENVFGGPGAKAPQFITAKEERELEAGGQKVVNLQTTAFELEMARLKARLARTGTDAAGAKERYYTEQAIKDLPEEFARRKQQREYQREVQVAQERVTPLRDFGIELQRLALEPGAVGGMGDEVQKYLETLPGIMERAITTYSKGEMLSYIASRESEYTPADYAKEVARVSAIETPRQFGGLLIPDIKKMSEFREKYSDMIKEAPTLDMKRMSEAIANPIGIKIDASNDLLALIAMNTGVSTSLLKTAQTKLGDRAKEDVKRGDKEVKDAQDAFGKAGDSAKAQSDFPLIPDIRSLMKGQIELGAAPFTVDPKDQLAQKQALPGYLTAALPEPKLARRHPGDVLEDLRYDFSTDFLLKTLNAKALEADKIPVPPDAIGITPETREKFTSTMTGREEREAQSKRWDDQQQEAALGVAAFVSMVVGSLGLANLAGPVASIGSLAYDASKTVPADRYDTITQKIMASIAELLPAGAPMGAFNYSNKDGVSSTSKEDAMLIQKIEALEILITKDKYKEYAGSQITDDIKNIVKEDPQKFDQLAEYIEKNSVSLQDVTSYLEANTQALADLKQSIKDFNASQTGRGEDPAPVKKAPGGRVFGEGGPREDKVPAMLSPGEYVLRQASAARIGYTELEEMNRTGKYPIPEGFAEGGGNSTNDAQFTKRWEEATRGGFRRVDPGQTTADKLWRWFKERILGDSFETTIDKMYKRVDEKREGLASGGLIPGFFFGGKKKKSPFDLTEDTLITPSAAQNIMNSSNFNQVFEAMTDDQAFALETFNRMAEETPERIEEVKKFMDAESAIGGLRQDRLNNMLKEMGLAGGGELSDRWLREYEAKRNRFDNIRDKYADFKIDTQPGDREIAKAAYSDWQKDYSKRYPKAYQAILAEEAESAGRSGFSRSDISALGDLAIGAAKDKEQPQPIMYDSMYKTSSRKNPAITTQEERMQNAARILAKDKLSQKIAKDPSMVMKKKYIALVSGAREKDTITYAGSAGDKASIYRPPSLRRGPTVQKGVEYGQILQALGKNKALMESGNYNDLMDEIRKMIGNKSSQSLQIKTVKDFFGGATGSSSNVSDFYSSTQNLQDLINSILNRNNQSRKSYHSGGEITQTGTIFAQKGEYIVPKGFAGGGVVTDSTTTQIATSAAPQSIKLDAGEILSQLNNLVVKLDPTYVAKVDPEATVKVDPEAIVGVDPSAFIQVDPNAVVKVDTEAVTIDASGIESAGARVASSIESALSTAVKVSVDDAGVSVGADKLDRLGEAIQTVQNQLVGTVKDVDKKITMLDQNMVDQGSVEMLLQTKINDLEGRLRSEINIVSSNASQSSGFNEIQNLESKIEMLNRKVSELATRSYSTGI